MDDGWIVYPPGFYRGLNLMLRDRYLAVSKSRPFRVMRMVMSVYLCVELHVSECPEQ